MKISKYVCRHWEASGIFRPIARGIWPRYEEPLHSVMVDDEGKEILCEEKGGKGILAWKERMNFTRIFQPRYVTDAVGWDAAASFPLFDLGAGESGSVNGTLRHKKRAAAAKPACSPDDDLVPVDVVGTLRSSGYLGLHKITNSLFVVEGTQFYRPKPREWMRGRLDVKLKYSLEFGEEKVGSCEGTRTYILGDRADEPRLPRAKK